MGLGFIGKLAKRIAGGTKSTGTISRKEWLANRNRWAKNADHSLVNPDGTPKMLFIGKARNNVEHFGKQKSYSDAVSPDDIRAYQKRGDTFATERPRFAEDFAYRDSAAQQGLIPVPQGEGNIYPVYANAKKMYDPDNPKHFRRNS